MEIQLSGIGEAYRRADRGVLTLQVNSKPCQTAQEADNAIVSVLNSLCDAIAPFCSKDNAKGQEDAPIAHYSIRTTRDTAKGRDRSGDSSMTMSFSKTSSYVSTYTASADFVIEFREFSLLARIATQTSAMENVKITSLDWTHTAASQTIVQDEAGANAMRDALHKAQNLAKAYVDIDAEKTFSVSVKPVQIKEPKEGAYKKIMRRCRHEGFERGTRTQKSDWDYEPLDVGVEVQIEGKFVVEV